MISSSPESPGAAPVDPWQEQRAVSALLDRFVGRQVVVVGDVFLDEYLVGQAERLSREGPVPVLAFQRRFCLPGGAANPAHNVAVLGGLPVLVGLMGDDDAGEELRMALEARGIRALGCVTDPTRPTTRKTRIVAEGLSAPQQVARIDNQCRDAVSGSAEEGLLAAIARLGDKADAVLVSHYRSGVATPAVVDAARRVSRSAGAVLTVDAQGDLDRFHDFDLVRVGRSDAAAHLGRPLASDADYEDAARDLRARLRAGAVILGRGASGTSLLDDEGYAVLPPANISEVYDVTGAGDTVIAVVTLALCAGAPLRQAVRLANRAAGIVVRRLGVVAPDGAAILATFTDARDDQQ